MANNNAPFGLRAVEQAGGGNFGGRWHRYYIPSADVAAYYLGSPVIPLAGADALGVPGVIVAAGTDVLLGAVQGVEAVSPTASMVGTNPNLERISIPATKTRAYYVWVSDDPMQEYYIQGDGTATNQVAANANKNAQLTIAAPSSVLLPYSATVIASSTIATTNTHNIRLMGLAQLPGNGFGAYAVWRAKINAHQNANLVAGI